VEDDLRHRHYVLPAGVRTGRREALATKASCAIQNRLATCWRNATKCALN